MRQSLAWRPKNDDYIPSQRLRCGAAALWSLTFSAQLSGDTSTAVHKSWRCSITWPVSNVYYRQLINQQQLHTPLCSLSLLFRWAVNYLYTLVFQGRQRSAGGHWRIFGGSRNPGWASLFSSRSLLAGAFPSGALAGLTGSLPAYWALKHQHFWEHVLFPTLSPFAVNSLSYGVPGGRCQGPFIFTISWINHLHSAANARHITAVSSTATFISSGSKPLKLGKTRQLPVPFNCF